VRVQLRERVTDEVGGERVGVRVLELVIVATGVEVQVGLAVRVTEEPENESKVGLGVARLGERVEQLGLYVKVRSEGVRVKLRVKGREAVQLAENVVPVAVSDCPVGVAVPEELNVGLQVSVTVMDGGDTVPVVVRERLAVQE